MRPVPPPWPLENETLHSLCPVHHPQATTVEDPTDGTPVGAVIRVMAESSADAYVFVQQCLQPLEALVGTLPFTGGTAGGAALQRL